MYKHCGECQNLQTTLWLPMEVVTYKCDNVDLLHLDKETPACPNFTRKEADHAQD